MDTLFSISPDGTRIAYDVTGDGPALMLLHGGGQTRNNWHEIGYVARLKDDFKVITVDIRGNGQSDQPTDPAAYTTDLLGQDLLAVADACGVERFTIWGFSYGGNIARYLAAKSDRVAKFILIGIPFGLGAPGDFRQFIKEFQSEWAPIVAAHQAGTLDSNSLSKDQRSTWQSRDVPVTLAWLSAMLDWAAIEPGDLRCPTLWLVGSKNEGAIASVHAYEHALAGTPVQVCVIEGLTHTQEFVGIDAVLPEMLAFTSRS